MDSSGLGSIEEQIGVWRAYAQTRAVFRAGEIQQSESLLRDQLRVLGTSGLSADEAFLIAIHRMGSVDARWREFGRAHVERAWKQSPSAAPPRDASRARREGAVIVLLAVVAALVVKSPALFGHPLDESHASWYARNAALLVFPWLIAYFVWKRRIGLRGCAPLIAALGAAAVLANVWPFMRDGQTEHLAALHLPIALWLVVGIAYAGGRWWTQASAMNFVRFSGEVFIYYVLVALGGGVLTMFTMLMFNAIGIHVERLVQSWLVPCGAAGAVLICAGLVEAKQSVLENLAPVLTRLFTPLFALVLLGFLLTMLITRSGIDVHREALIGFDLLLAVVLGLLLYAVSARDPLLPPGGFDMLQLVLIVSALLVDALALAAIAARISEFGFTANRSAALGENLILFGNLARSAWLYAAFVRGRGAFAALERWQVAYLPVYSLWAALIVAVFPWLFGYR